MLKTIKLAIIGCVASFNTFAGPVDDFQDFVLDTIDAAELHGVWSSTTDGRHGFGGAMLFKVKRFTVQDKVNFDLGPAYVLANVEDEITQKIRVRKRRFINLTQEQDSIRSIAQIGCAISLQPDPGKNASNLSSMPIIRNLNINFSLSKVYIGVGSFMDEYEPVFSVGIGGISFGN